MTTGKRGSLADFAVNKPASQAAPVEKAPGERQRGKGEFVALTLRVKRDQWQRIHELALHEGKSINGLMIEGLSSLLEGKGLPPL